jgi:hypothetical protein
MPANRSDIPGIGMAVLFIVVGLFVIYDTTTYQDLDSAVFPRTVAIIMIFFSILLIVWNLLKPQVAEAAEGEGGSIVRRVVLVVVMIAASAAMPFIGLLLSALISFGALMAVAMFEPWTRNRVIVYSISAVVLVVGFHWLFGEIFQVPLPVGSLFE